MYYCMSSIVLLKNIQNTKNCPIKKMKNEVKMHFAHLIQKISSN